MKKLFFVLITVLSVSNFQLFAQNLKTDDPAEKFDDGLLINRKNNLVYSGGLQIFQDTINYMSQNDGAISALLIFNQDDQSYTLSFTDAIGGIVKYLFSLDEKNSTQNCKLLSDNNGEKWCVVDNLKNTGQLKLYNNSKQEMKLFTYKL